MSTTRLREGVPYPQGATCDTPDPPLKHADVNAVAGGLLRDLAFTQTSDQNMFGYKRAAAAVLSLEQPLSALVRQDGTLTKIPGIGPASTRVILEVLETGTSQTVEQAVERSGRGADIQRRRAPPRAFSESGRSPSHPRRSCLCRARAPRSIRAICRCTQSGVMAPLRSTRSSRPASTRGYSYAAVTDHSHGLKIAGGMSMAEAAEQHEEIDGLNKAYRTRFRLIRGIEANIGSDGRPGLYRLKRLNSLNLSWPRHIRSFEKVRIRPNGSSPRSRTCTCTCSLIRGAVFQDRGRESWPSGTEYSRGGTRRRGDRNRRRSSAAGSRPHAGRPRTPGGMCLCAGQRRACDDSAALCRNCHRTRAACLHPSATHCQLLAH